MGGFGCFLEGFWMPSERFFNTVWEVCREVFYVFSVVLFYVDVFVVDLC